MWPNKDKDKDSNEVKTTIGDVFINKAVEHVMNSMNHEEDNVLIRHKIATSMKRAINMSKQAGGDITEPQKTVLYRFATLLDGCKSFEELENKCIKAFDNRTDCKAHKLLVKFDYDWKMNFSVPIIEKKTRKNSKDNGEAFPSEDLTPQQPDEKLIEQQETKAVEILATAVMRIEDLERRVEKLTKKFRAHTHLEGKVVVITEV